ncbi:MAG: methionyl-tRNA formyltransferase [Sulfuricurvum sp.]|uniref:methionyl-tRNA formyltransferase n=1 Tax=Sulfuricurvum sp. TaxID=2025608 RepID=UPI00263199C6|nr:methionyl-tRNA formyltransferase [Sulfuricurvum sp.]MDD2829290.1 methionyl-tRNA formyltransferase [Sulfuricurvum sp.]MDD4948607.1 methionyl-tRNA formyltransferase [Sulfuricurvum sp.]
MIRVLFMGTPEYATEIFKALVESNDIEVVGVYTQPDKPVGRHNLLTPPSVKVAALEKYIPIYQPSRLRDVEVIEQVKSIECDLIVVAAYGQILPKEILEYVPCINLHASILPQYRGASPIQQSLLNNDTQSGVTAMWMDEGLDTGAIIKIETIDIDPNEMVSSLYERLTTLACDLTLDVVRSWDRASATPQDETKASHCKKISKADGCIAFDNASEIFNRYRAFTPWPGIYLESGLKIKKMGLEESLSTGHAGEIIEISTESIVVQCLKGSLRMYTLQAPSKSETASTAYLNGKRLVCGNTLA